MECAMNNSPGLLAPYDLTGMRILITGAAGGIGGATARLCAQLGADLMLTDQGEAPASLLGDIAARGRAAQYAPCDVRSRDAVAAFCAAMGPIDAAVLNAGILSTESLDDPGYEESFAQIMAVNVGGPTNFVRHILPAMKQRGKGRIVLMGSVAAHTGGTHPHSPLHYAASKGAVHSMLRWMARRGAPEVLVNLVAPGSTETRMVAMADPAAMKAVPIPRFGRPEEIAWPIAFLCSPGASYICGATLDVNGGAYIR